MSEGSAILRPKWGLYRDDELVIAHDSREVLEAYLRDLVKLHGENQNELEIKPYSGS